MLKQAQIKVLNEELKSATWIQSQQIAKRRLPKGKQVRAAERIVAAHERKVRRAAAQMERAYAKLKVKAKHAIYFGTEKEAMLAIRAAIKFYMDHSQ